MERIELVIYLLLGFMVLLCVVETYGIVSDTKPAKSSKREDTIESSMYKGILEIRGNYKYINKTYAKKLVREVMEVTSLPENRWMPPHILLGLALNESDLRWWIITGGRHTQDCGICQNHTPLFAKSYKQRDILCKRLTKSSKLSLEYAMKELNIIKSRWCKRYFKKIQRKKNETIRSFKFRLKYIKQYKYRCLLNVYNQGPRYVLSTCKSRITKNKYTLKKYTQIMRQCLYVNNYWIRSICFSTGLRLGRRGKISCRHAYNLNWVVKNYH